MSKVHLNLDVDDDRWFAAMADTEAAAEMVKEMVFSYVESYEGLPVLTQDKPLTVNVCLSTDERVWQLNKEFRNVDRPTNVLSFANIDGEYFSEECLAGDEIELGDIILAYETMCREAESEGISLYAHFCHLLTHGFLHLLGYDHMEEEEAQYMENIETDVLAEMGIDNPYLNREE